jgi:hypothetical protein
MTVHLVLFRPRADLTNDQRAALASSFELALSAIPAIRRARVGRRVTIGRAYEQLMRSDYPYAAVIEFDDATALRAYLDHPAHQQLAALFFESFDDALIYDFELEEGTAALAALLADAQ